jgi:hypothetical protein
MAHIAGDQDEPLGPIHIIRIPDPVKVRDLASAMQLKPHRLIDDLMGFELYLSVNSLIDFGTASRLCAKHGMIARLSI